MLAAAWLAMTTFGWAPAHAAQCRLPNLETTVKLTEKRGRQRLSNGFTGRQLERKRQRAGHAASPGPNWHPVGLMGRDLVWELRVQVMGRKTDRGFCVGLQHADMVVGYDRIDVYIDRRYRPGSCEYHVILEHEQQHVRNFKNTLARYMPEIRRKLKAEATRIGPRQARSMERGADRFVKTLKSRMTPLIRRMQQEMDATDRRIDTPANYRATQARCENW